MTEDQCSQADVCSTVAPAIASSSSSEDEGCARARCWSVDGGQKDALIQSPGSSSFVPTLEIPSNEACAASAVHVSSTPSSPAKHANFDVNAMFQRSSSAELLADVPLEHEENTEPLSAAAETAPEDIYSELGASLSALSKSSLPSVSEKLIAWAKRSREESDDCTLSAVVGLIFEKAIGNAVKSELYAELCHTVMEHFDPDIHDGQMKDVDSEPNPRPQVFRKCLLDRCQDSFERGLSEEAGSSVDASQQSVGLMKFIGELFKTKVLTQKMMYECIQTLLTHFESAEEPGYCIDCLEVLLTTAGRRLDSRKARTHVDEFFAHIQGLARSSAVTSLHRHKLQSLINLRQTWKNNQVTQPTTVGDDALWGHPLGDMNVSSRRQRPSHIDPYDSWQSTETKLGDVPSGTAEPAPAPPMSESDATVRAERNSVDFLSTCDLAAAERHFAQLPPGYHHILVHALVDKAIFSDAEASLVAMLFDRVAAANLCSPAAFEDGFEPTTRHLAGIAKSVPDAFESYARMFKGARLGADEDRCIRIASMSTEGEELMLLLFSPTVSLDSELVESSEPSPRAALNVLKSATAAPVSTPSEPSVVPDEEVPSSGSAPPCTVDSDRQSSDDDDDLYADYTENYAIPISHIPAPATTLQRRTDRQEATNQPISTLASQATDRIHVEERVSEPSTPSTPGSPNLPLVRLRMSQNEANKRIEQCVAQLFGGPHDIDAVLSVFTAVPARHHSRLVDRIVSFTIESTPADAQLVAYFFYCAAAQGLCARGAFEGGFAVTAAALDDVAAESPEAVLLFATMARGAGLHKDADWRKRVFGRLERLGYGPDLTSSLTSLG